jgi:hypothetical protein
MNGGTDPAVKRFPPETLHALFEAVEINDAVDPKVHLPDPIDLKCTEAEMRWCFALCLQFWSEGAHRSDLVRLVNTLLLSGDLPPAERLRYKHIRARYKQLRFAVTLYDMRHSVPLLFRVTITTMGRLQDAFRNGRRTAVTGHALLLRALLASPLWALARRRVGAFRLDTAEGFLAYRKGEIRQLKEMLERETLTGREFHTMRKIVSRQVSFYDARRTLERRTHDHAMSRFLSSINGLMGRSHDVMVERAISGERDYNSPVRLDADIRQRLETLVARYPL